LFGRPKVTADVISSDPARLADQVCRTYSYVSTKTLMIEQAVLYLENINIYFLEVTNS